MSDVKHQILDFLGTHSECVLATVSEQGHPEAAVVGFSENEKLELVIGTTRKSRKFQNIQSNPRVAVVVGFQDAVTVQYEGTARELAGEELEARLVDYFKKKPDAMKYRNEADQVYLLITPTWVRYTDFTQSEHAIEELRVFE